jgi:hypothetical protein
MFSLPGLVALLVAQYTKVHELSPLIRTAPTMHLVYAAACLGLLLDLRLGLVRFEISPLMRVALPLALWSVLTVPLTGGMLGFQVNLTLTYFLVFFVIAQAVQSFRALRVVALSILSISLFLGGIAILQARSPFQCVLVDASVPGDEVGRSDGRDCESNIECRVNAGPGEDYVCERPGPLNTTSVGHGRVSYRGILADPNELALALCMVIPLALTISLRKRSLWRPLLLVATVAVVLPVTVWTGSRTGQLVFVTVLAVYMLQRAGWKGLLAATVLAAPVLLLGGRSGGEADESSMERLEAWGAGLHMFTSSPVWGIGKGQFTEHHIRTAHNTFMLLLAELGLVGLALWIGMFYVALKIVLLAAHRYRDRPDGEMAYEWARALLACLCGLAVGTSFLSLGYHPVVWAIMALPGAYYLAVRRHDPEFRVTFSLRDGLAVTGLTLSYVVGVTGYLTLRGVY